MTPVGQMRHYCEIQRCTESQDAAGGSVKTWARFANAWLKISGVFGDEVEYGEKMVGRVTHEAIGRDLPGIRPTDRIQTDTGQILEIVSAVDPDDRSYETHMKCVLVQ